MWLKSRTSDEVVNLKHAVKVWLKDRRLYALMTDGMTIELDQPYNEEYAKRYFETQFNTLMPAQSGQEAVVITCRRHPSEDECPTEEDIETNKYPIIAWRVKATGGAIPVLPNGLIDTGSCWVLVAYPDGRFSRGFVGGDYTLHQARQALLGSQQNEWKKQHPKNKKLNRS